MQGIADASDHRFGLQWEYSSHRGVGLMAVRQRRYSKEHLAEQGQALYEAGIQQQVEAGNEGKIVAIDIETGDFEVDETVMGATDRLFERHPDAQPWGIRIGYRAVYHLRSRNLKRVI
jgi:hypothetical protein